MPGLFLFSLKSSFTDLGKSQYYFKEVDFSIEYVYELANNQTDYPEGVTKWKSFSSRTVSSAYQPSRR